MKLVPTMTKLPKNKTAKAAKAEATTPAPTEVTIPTKGMSQDIPRDHILVDYRQNTERVRSHFTDDQIKEIMTSVSDRLVDSIREKGLLAPVIVFKDGDNYKVVAGYSRMWALDRLKWKSIPCRVFPTATDAVIEARSIQAAENGVRTQGNTWYRMQEAIASYAKLGDTDEWKSYAKSVGFNKSEALWVPRFAELSEDTVAMFDAVAGRIDSPWDIADLKDFSTGTGESFEWQNEDVIKAVIAKIPDSRRPYNGELAREIINVQGILASTSKGGKVETVEAIDAKTGKMVTVARDHAEPIFAKEPDAEGNPVPVVDENGNQLYRVASAANSKQSKNGKTEEVVKPVHQPGYIQTDEMEKQVLDVIKTKRTALIASEAEDLINRAANLIREVPGQLDRTVLALRKHYKVKDGKRVPVMEEIVVGQEPAKNKDGTVKTDKDGKPVMQDKVETVEKKVMVAKTDKNGAPVLGKDGKPVMVRGNTTVYQKHYARPTEMRYYLAGLIIGASMLRKAGNDDHYGRAIDPTDRSLKYADKVNNDQVAAQSAMVTILTEVIESCRGDSDILQAITGLSGDDKDLEETGGELLDQIRDAVVTARKGNLMFSENVQVQKTDAKGKPVIGKDGKPETESSTIAHGIYDQIQALADQVKEQKEEADRIAREEKAKAEAAAKAKKTEAEGKGKPGKVKAEVIEVEETDDQGDDE